MVVVVVVVVIVKRGVKNCAACGGSGSGEMKRHLNRYLARLDILAGSALTSWSSPPPPSTAVGFTIDPSPILHYQPGGTSRITSRHGGTASMATGHHTGVSRGPLTVGGILRQEESGGNQCGEWWGGVQVSSSIGQGGSGSKKR